MTAAARASGHSPAISALRIELVDAQGAQIASAGIVVCGDELPDLVMCDGEPFLRDPARGAAIYRHVRPYRIDSGF